MSANINIAFQTRSCKHFRWLPGMLLVGAAVPARFPWNPGDPVLTCTPIRITSVDSDGYPWGQFSTGTRGGWGSFRDGFPDPHDAATQGCMLTLIAERTGSMSDTLADIAHRMRRGATHARALVEALESCP